MSNIPYLTSQIPQGHPYSQMPAYFDLPPWYQDGYSRPWPNGLPDPYDQDIPFRASQSRLVSRHAKYDLSQQEHIIPQDHPRYFHYEAPLRPTTVHNDYANRPNVPREYYPGVAGSYQRPPISQELMIAREFMRRKDATIMMLVGLAVVEGLVILSLARNQPRTL